jgi:hypothetical protein
MQIFGQNICPKTRNTCPNVGKWVSLGLKNLFIHIVGNFTTGAGLCSFRSLSDVWGRVGRTSRPSGRARAIPVLSGILSAVGQCAMFQLYSFFSFRKNGVRIPRLFRPCGFIDFQTFLMLHTLIPHSIFILGHVSDVGIALCFGVFSIIGVARVQTLFILPLS